MRAKAQEFVRQVTAASSAADLSAALRAISSDMGFEYFALSHHVDMARAGNDAIRLHNYPDKWADYYDSNALGVSDPVHRASHVTNVGFVWSDMQALIALTPDDRRVLALGSEQGIGDGFTVPANVPGESRGSCSFANVADVAMDEDMLPLAQLVGMFAFECARRLWVVRPPDFSPPRLTDRQRDCLLWAGRGKSDWEISRILGISEDTVDRHLKNARERYGVPKRTMVVVRALFDGTLSFSDVLPH
ncbi:MAG: LuxR family transcriptional regulator [Sphingomonadaceae bacterium]|nr:LuxR family transcriptional regulator [Sphingomonadaceae bacterium]